jgi:hypothetical protein
MDTGWMVPVGVCGSIAVSYMFTTRVRARHGYPIESDNGELVAKDGSLPAKRQVELLGNENAALRAQLIRLEERMATMERIATDPANRLDREIASLTTRAN